MVLYEALAGAPPFRGQSRLAMQDAILRQEPPPLQHAHELAPLIGRLLEKDPGRRPSARDALGLLHLGGSEPLPGDHTSMPQAQPYPPAGQAQPSSPAPVPFTHGWAPPPRPAPPGVPLAPRYSMWHFLSRARTFLRRLRSSPFKNRRLAPLSASHSMRLPLFGSAAVLIACLLAAGVLNAKSVPHLDVDAGWPWAVFWGGLGFAAWQIAIAVRRERSGGSGRAVLRLLFSPLRPPARWDDAEREARRNRIEAAIDDELRMLDARMARAWTPPHDEHYGEHL